MKIRTQECVAHKWQASIESVFGLKNINAILICKSCASSPTKFLGIRPITDFDVVYSKSGAPTYFLKESAAG